MRPNEDLLKQLNALIPYINRIEDVANKVGIADISNANNLRTFQVLARTGLRALSGNKGNDAFDPDGGDESEIKSAQLNRKTFSCINGSRHGFTEETYLRYCKVNWVFGGFDAAVCAQVWQVPTDILKDNYFNGWLKSNPANGSIPLSFIQEHGTLLY